MRAAEITGAACGIGGAIARALADSGYEVALLNRVRPQPLEDGEGLALAVDLTDPDAVGTSFERIRGAFGALDALVNVAGINHRSPVATMEVPDWDRMMDTNVGSMFLTAKFGLPLLEKGRGRAIVNMALVSGHVASSDFLAHAMTKAAVECSTTALSQEAGDRGIRASAVAPVWVITGFTDHAKAGTDDPALQDAASFVTGTELIGDGGFLCRH